MTPSEELTSLFTLERRADLVMRQAGFGLALYDPAYDQLFILNPVAAVVWRHITPDRTSKHIIDALEISFPGIEHQKLVDDVTKLVGDLQNNGLLVPTGQDAPKPKVGRHNRIVIRQEQVSPVTQGYVPPEVKAFTSAEIEVMFGNPGSSPPYFRDVWYPM
jgi:hypothetical protein